MDKSCRIIPTKSHPGSVDNSNLSGETGELSTDLLYWQLANNS